MKNPMYEGDGDAALLGKNSKLKKKQRHTEEMKRKSNKHSYFQSLYVYYRSA